MALHEFYLEQFGPVRTDLDEAVVQGLRDTWKQGITEEEIDSFFSDKVSSFQDRCFYIIASQYDPDTFTHFNSNWQALYQVLKAVWITGDWRKGDPDLLSQQSLGYLQD
jgi:hypothetical protein